MDSSVARASRLFSLFKDKSSLLKKSLDFKMLTQHVLKQLSPNKMAAHRWPTCLPNMVVHLANGKGVWALEASVLGGGKTLGLLAE